MTNSFFNSSGAPGNRAPRASSPLRAQFAAVAAGFDKFPTLSGNGGKLLAINSGGTAFEALSAVTDAMLPSSMAEKAIAGTNLSSYSSSDTAITTLITGSNAGTLLEGKSGDHFVVGVRSAALTDGFHIISKGAAGDPDADDYDTLLLSVTSEGITSGLPANFASLTVGGAGLVADSRQISAGSGLSGGGTLAADRTLSLDTGSSRNTDHAAVSITAGSGLSGGGTIAATRTLSLDTGSTRNVDHAAVSISAGTGLSGGGTLAADRTLSLDTTNTRNVDHATVSITAGSGLSGGGTIAATRTLSLDTSNARNVDHSAVSITAGAGLTGGGTLAATRTLAVDIAGQTAISPQTLSGDDAIMASHDGALYRIRYREVGRFIKTASTTTLAQADINKLILNTSSSSYTLTVPPNSSVQITIGLCVDIACYGSGTVTIAAGSGVTVRSLNSALTVSGSGGMATLMKIATDLWMLVGALE